MILVRFRRNILTYLFTVVKMVDSHLKDLVLFLLKPI